MKLLYVAPLPIDFDNLDGVPKKILCQAEALNKKFEVDIIYYFAGKVCLYNVSNKDVKALGKAKSKLDVLKAVCSHIEDVEYSATYIRYPRSDYYFIKILKKLKKQAIIVFVEIPTYPYDKEGKESLKGRIINGLDKFYRKKLKGYVHKIVTYSDDESIWGIETINTRNGINFDNISYDSTSLDLSKEINLVAVSAMYRVHGYERLLEGLRDYYQRGGNRNIHLKLVGKGDECTKYQELVAEYNLDSNVTFYGAKFGKELEEIYKENSMGINSLAIHRQGLEHESTLKAKEYAAKGLPILSSSFVDSFSQEGNEKFVLRIPADETPVDVEQLIQFVDKLYQTDNDSTDSTKKLREKIREEGRKNCDIEVTMKPVIDELLAELHW